MGGRGLDYVRLNAAAGRTTRWGPARKGRSPRRDGRARRCPAGGPGSHLSRQNGRLRVLGEGPLEAVAEVRAGVGEGGAGLAGGVDLDLLEGGRDSLVGVVDVHVLAGDLTDPARRAAAVEADPEGEAVAAAVGAEDVVVAHRLVRGHPDVHLVLVRLVRLQGGRGPDDVAGPGPGELLGPQQRAAAGDVGLQAESALTRFPGRVEHEGDLGQVV